MSRIESLDQLSQPELIHHINVYNCCMSRRVSSCRLRLVSQDEKEEDKLRGGIKINFRFANPVQVLNSICVDGKNKQEFITSFKFSRNNTLIFTVTDKDSTADVLRNLRQKFNVIPSLEGLALFERESASSSTRHYHEAFYRRLRDTEKPLELSLVWSVNGERKSLILADHDPNRVYYDSFELDQLTLKIQKLEEEEEEAVAAVRKKYCDLKKFLQDILDKKLWSGT